MMLSNKLSETFFSQRVLRSSQPTQRAPDAGDCRGIFKHVIGMESEPPTLWHLTILYLEWDKCKTQ